MFRFSFSHLACLVTTQLPKLGKSLQEKCHLCSDELTKNYYLNLQLSSALRNFIASIGSLHSCLDCKFIILFMLTTLISCIYIDHNIIRIFFHWERNASCNHNQNIQTGSGLFWSEGRCGVSDNLFNRKIFMSCKHLIWSFLSCWNTYILSVLTLVG